MITILRFTTQTCLKFLNILNSISVHITDRVHVRLRSTVVAKISSIFGKPIIILLVILKFMIHAQVSFIDDQKTLTYRILSQITILLHSRLLNKLIVKAVFLNSTL